MRLGFFCIFLCAFHHGNSQDGLVAKVREVPDGNTLIVGTADHETLTIVLMGIDCPELAQPYGDRAKTYLEKRLLNKCVTIHIHGKDRLRNYVAVVLLDNVDIRLDLLTQGLAWTQEKGGEREFEKLRLKTAATRQGLWSESDPVPPWLFRRQQSILQPKSQ